MDKKGFFLGFRDFYEIRTERDFLIYQIQTSNNIL